MSQSQTGSAESVAGQAVAAKLHELYDRDDQFVAFTQIPMTGDQLAFATEGFGDIRNLQAFADFSYLVNQGLDVGPVWEPNGRLLWEVYGDVLKQRVANRELTDAEQAELDASTEVLYRDDGTPSAIYETYLEFRNAYDDVEDQLNIVEITIESTDSEELRAQKEIERDQLRDDLKRANQDWVGLGHKHTVDGALETRDRLTGYGPRTVWRQWEQKFGLSEGEQNWDALIDRPFRESDFYPRTFYREGSEGSWNDFTLDESEIGSLLDRSTAGIDTLDDAVGTEQFEGDISRLSVQLARVTVGRGWFSPEAFGSRLWKWTRDREPISDGGDPPTGQFPAYVSSLVFARDLTVTLSPDSDSNEEAVAKLQAGLNLSLGPLLLNAVPSTAKPQTVRTLHSAVFDPKETALVHAFADVERAKPEARINAALASTRTPNAIRASVAQPTFAASVRPTTTVRAHTGTHGTTTKVRHPESVASESATVAKANPMVATLAMSSPKFAVTKPIVAPTISKPKPTDFGHIRIPHKFVNIGPVLVGPVSVKPYETGYQGKVIERTQSGLGDPIDAARITFEKDDGSVRKSIQSDSRGHYKVTLPPGKYVVTARRFGYQDYTTGSGFFVVQSDEFRTGNVLMEPETTEERTVKLWHSMQLIGFICTKVPKSPNPDPELAWD